MKDDRCRRFLLTGALLLFAPPLFGVNVQVPSLELYTWGHMQGGVFGLETRADMGLRLDGGYKFGVRALFDFASETLEAEPMASPPATFAFRSVSVTLRDFLKLPLDFSYFVGEDGQLCSGDLFADYFGTAPIESNFTSFLYLPTAAFTYEGIYTPVGTGIQLDLGRLESPWLLSLYLYQDSHVDADGVSPFTFDPGHASLDIRYALNLSNVKLETFVGATYPVPESPYGSYRGGLLFYASFRTVEFLAEIGLPRFCPLADSFDVDLLYMLLEQRIRLGLVSIVQTFFWRPAYYQMQPTGERAIDVNLDVGLGRPESVFSGGLVGTFTYQTLAGGLAVNEFTTKVTPYVELTTSGVVFQARVPTKVWPFDLTDMFELFIAVRAAF
jgi:hypothetical protein